MTLDEIMNELASVATAQTKRTYLRHGAREPVFGVRIGDLKPFQKKLKGEQKLALELYATKNSDAMYLAGLIADGSKMTKRQLDQWANGATWHLIAGSTVPWVAAEHPQAVPIACKWIDSKKQLVAIAGWSTLSSVAAAVADEHLPVDTYSALLDRVALQLSSSPDRVSYSMNNFVISVGTYVAPLADKALTTAEKLGVVTVDMGDTSCKVPDAASYILKSRRGAQTAPKRQTTRC